MTMTAFPAKAHLLIDPPSGAHRVVHHPVRGEYFRLGIREAAFLEQLDGSRSAAELAQHSDSGMSPDQIGRLLVWFEHNGLLAGAAPAPAPAPVRLRWHRRIWAYATGEQQFRIEMLDPDRFLDRHLATVHALFGRPAAVIYLLILLAPAVLTIFAPSLVKQALGHYAFSLSVAKVAILLALIIGTIFLHEMGHALACKHFGGKVEKIGIKFMYLMPVMYCDVSASWRFHQVAHKIAVAAAGIFVQFILGSIAFMAWVVSGHDVLLHFVLLNLFIAIFNFYPFVKLDGYWMLVHALNEPNLRANSFAQLDRLLRAGLGLPRASVKGGPLLLAFGIGAALSAPLFFYLGAKAIYRYAALISPQLASLAAIGIVAVAACRYANPVRHYLASLRSPQQRDQLPPSH